MCDPVGQKEIAERLGVKSQTARVWLNRQLLPDPAYVVSGCPAWEWRTIRRWAQATGRL